MKKILAILCGVTMMFAACTPGGGEEPTTPNFPEETTAEVLAGDHYDLKFAANMAWTVSLENDYYATLRYNYENGTEFSGEAAEKVKMEVVIKKDIKNYVTTLKKHFFLTLLMQHFFFLMIKEIYITFFVKKQT